MALYRLKIDFSSLIFGMKFTFVTLFPELIKGYFDASIVGRAKERGLIEIEFFNPRDFSKGKNRGVDAQMVGGGAGMLLSPEPLGRAIEHIKASNSESHTVFLSLWESLLDRMMPKDLEEKDTLYLCLEDMRELMRE